MKEDAFGIISSLNLSEDKMPLGLCLYNKNWHQGVIGIIAGRLKDRYHRPTIIFAEGCEETIKGSARSIAGVHIRDVLDALSKQDDTLIEKFGGHAMAAGLTIKKHKLEVFQKAFVTELSKHMSQDDCIGKVYSDGALQGNDFSLDTASMLENAGPWGQEFPRPIFDNEFELVDQRLLGGKHLKMSLRQPGSMNIIDAIAFNVKEGLWPNHRARKVHCAYHLDVNRYQGRSRLQLMIEHLEAVGE
jgi:single-stranded-DNA-specific exonuclease